MRHLPAARVGRLPKRFAGREIKCDEERVLATRRENNLVALHERALAGIPFGHRRAEFADETHAPLEFAAGGVEAEHVAFRVQGDDKFFRDDGHGARHAVVALDRERIAEAPKLLPVRERKATQRALLRVAVVVEEIDATSAHRDAGVTFAHVERPEFARRRSFPIAGKFGWLDRHAVAIWPAKLRPRAGQLTGLAAAGNQLACQDGIGARRYVAGRGVRAGDAESEPFASARTPPERQRHDAQHRDGEWQQRAEYFPIALHIPLRATLTESLGRDNPELSGRTAIHTGDVPAHAMREGRPPQARFKFFNTRTVEAALLSV